MFVICLDGHTQVEWCKWIRYNSAQRLIMVVLKQGMYTRVHVSVTRNMTVFTYSLLLPLQI